MWQCFGTHFSGAPWYICWRYFFFGLKFCEVSEFFLGFCFEKDQNINVWCSVLTGVAVCCSVLQFVEFCICVDKNMQQRVLQCAYMLLCVHTQTSSIERGKNKVCCSVLQCVAECCSVLQFVGFCIFMDKKKPRSVLQCVAVCCSVLQCNAL